MKTQEQQEAQFLASMHKIDRLQRENLQMQQMLRTAFVWNLEAGTNLEATQRRCTALLEVARAAQHVVKASDAASLPPAEDFMAFAVDLLSKALAAAKNPPKSTGKSLRLVSQFVDEAGNVVPTLPMETVALVRRSDFDLVLKALDIAIENICTEQTTLEALRACDGTAEEMRARLLADARIILGER